MTTIAPDFADMASLAVNALVERIDATSPIEHRGIRCRYELVPGESTQPPAADRAGATPETAPATA